MAQLVLVVAATLLAVPLFAIGGSRRDAVPVRVRSRSGRR